MKKSVAGVMLVLVLAVAALPAPAEARSRFWPGFAVGTASGLVLGTVFAPRYYYPPAPVYYGPPAYYYAPPPVYVAPAPVCYQSYSPGYWTTVPVYDGRGYTTYQYQYVPDRYQTVCR